MRCILPFIMLVHVAADGVCGPMYTADCGQFYSVTSCTCPPGATDQACARATELQYFTFDSASQTFMYCQWQFAAFAGGMQCGRGSTCTPSATPAFQVCQSNLQAKTAESASLYDVINQLNLQLYESKANATRLLSQLETQKIDNQELRMQLARGGIFTVDLQTEIEQNFTRDTLATIALNQSLQDALDNVTYYQRLICPAGMGCCYNSATTNAPVLVAALLFIMFT